MKQSLPSCTWNQTKIKGTQSAHKIKQKIKSMKCNKKQWKHDATKEEVWEAQEEALEVWEAPQVLRNVTKQERRNERRQDH